MTARLFIASSIIVILSAGLLPVHVSTTQAQTSRAVWEEVSGISETVNLVDVVMLSSISAWVVGSDYQENTPKGFVYHLTLREGRWQAAVETTFNDEPLGISAHSENDIWVVGRNGLIAHKNAAGWQQMRERTTSATLSTVVMTPGGDDGWAAGELVTSSASTGPILLHYVNGQWAVDSGITGDVGGGINGLSFVGESGWAAGNSGIWRYDNRRWQQEPLPQLCEGCYARMNDVHAVSTEEAWAVGTRSTTCQGCEFNLYLLHRDGGAWQSVLPVARLGDELRQSSLLHAVDFADNNHGWAVGNLGNGADNRPLLLSYREGIWARDEVPLRSGRLTAVSASDASHVLAVGDHGTILSYGARLPSPNERCFPETGQCINGRFPEFWERHGGLPVFGFPISKAASETNVDTGKTYFTQWFERNRFELHPENTAPYDVLLGSLGVDRLRKLGRDWQQFPKAPPNAQHYFPETGHAIVHEAFWGYWSSHGLEFDGRTGKSAQESLALFGLPISEPMMETNSSGDRVLTQWFERARFEDHGAKGVLLGLLGNEVRGGPAPRSQ